MKNGLQLFGVIAAVATIGLSMAGCRTEPEIMTEPGAAAWSYNPTAPLGNYVVLGAIVVEDAQPEEILAALMHQAIEMGGHDITSVRLSVVNRRSGPVAQRGQWITATAVVIKYVDEVSLQGNGDG